MVRVLVFGANGFISSHLVRHMREQGALVFPAARGLPAPGLLRCDVTDAAEVRTAFEVARPHLVFQLAGTCAASAPATHYRVHTIGAVNVMESAAALAPRAVLVFMGSAAEYGETAPADLPVRESQPERPGTFYGAAKLAQTLAASVGSRTLGVRTTVVRPFNIIGPGLPGHYFLGALAEQLAERAQQASPDAVPVYNAESTRDYLDVRDAARALWLLGSHLFDGNAGPEVFNLCSGEEVPILLPAQRLAARFGAIPLFDAGPGPGRSGVQRSVGDPGKLQDRIGWRPGIGWEQSVDDFFAARAAGGPSTKP